MTFAITSPAFPDQGDIPEEFTCDGHDLAPPLAWTGVPGGTQSLTLVVDDLDAPVPAAPRQRWVHWVLYDMPPDASGIQKGASQLPKGTREGRNDWHRVGYRGPCQPSGRHRYRFQLYALDTRLHELAQPTHAALQEAMRGHVIAVTALVGTYALRDARGSYSSSPGTRA